MCSWRAFSDSASELLWFPDALNGVVRGYRNADLQGHVELDLLIMPRTGIDPRERDTASP